MFAGRIVAHEAGCFGLCQCIRAGLLPSAIVGRFRVKAVYYIIETCGIEHMKSGRNLLYPGVIYLNASDHRSLV